MFEVPPNQVADCLHRKPAYADGLDEFGYENSPLEKMAYDAEVSFKRSSAIFDAEKLVAEQLGRSQSPILPNSR